MPTTNRHDSLDARTPTTTYDDGKWVRTALVITAGHDDGSVDVVDERGRRLAQINIFHQPDGAEGECLMVDVINVDSRYPVRRALVFSPSERASLNVPEGGRLVGTHFARPASPEAEQTQAVRRRSRSS